VNESFIDEVSQALARGASFNELFAILRAYKESGLTQRSAYESLELVRARVGEPLDDIVMELMDIVVGFCNPRNRLWETPLLT
jgi:hypothetical protein